MTDKEMNREVALKVMGWKEQCNPHKPVDSDEHNASCVYTNENVYINEDGGALTYKVTLKCNVNDWNPTKDPSAYMQVVERIMDEGGRVNMQSTPSYEYYNWLVTISGFKNNVLDFQVDNMSLGQAICKVALEAVK